LGRAVHLAGVADTDEILAELERTAANAFGAPAARIAVWNADYACLFVDASPLPDALTRAWTEPRPSRIQQDLSKNHTSAFGLDNPQATLSAPITMHAKRLGVLFVFATRSPVFANSDLELIQLLADQTAVILEAKALTDQSAQIRAREEATRL